ncbi:GNAT family N-acetyltransferase [Enterococcus sp. AZ072]|uniref:GNAT family N-acetyltransferase n=1 Tax=unclassified Enterococcus TaxID=2608891 RepID=UPI003D290263
MEINKVEQLTDIHNQLLLLADPNQLLVDDYAQRGTVYEATEDETLVGIMVLLPTRPETIELVNIAVAEVHQGKGIAQEMIAFALQTAKQSGFHTIEVGTGSIGFEQLYLYQKCGFRMVAIDRDFFVRHYEEAIVIENGMVLQDMVRLSQDL